LIWNLSAVKSLHLFAHTFNCLLYRSLPPCIPPSLTYSLTHLFSHAFIHLLIFLFDFFFLQIIFLAQKYMQDIFFLLKNAEFLLAKKGFHEYFFHPCGPRLSLQPLGFRASAILSRNTSGWRVGQLYMVQL